MKHQYKGLGRAQVIPNRRPEMNEAQVYFSVRLKHESGNKEYYLFTPTQMAVALERARDQREDVIQPKTFWQKLWDLIDL